MHNLTRMTVKDCISGIVLRQLGRNEKALRMLKRAA